MAEANKPDRQRSEAHNALETLCDAFERHGFAAKKAYAADFTRLLDAHEMIFGNPNDPLDFKKAVDPEQGKSLLKGIKDAFDGVAAKEKALAETAIFYKKKHAETAEKFSQFSGLICKALKNL